MAKPGRKLTKVDSAVDSRDQTINTELIKQDLKAADAQVVALAEIDLRFGEGLPYDRTRVVQEARFFMAQSADSMLEAGKRLVLLKEHEAHGDFVQAVEQGLNLDLRSAERMMKASIKYLSPALESKSTSLSTLGKTKLFELMSQDDEELSSLDQGGTVAGLTLDDIDRMTTRELRQALRAAKAGETEELKAKDRLISDKAALIANKDEEINQLKLRTLASRPWTERAADYNAQAAAHFTLLAEQVARLEALRMTIMQAEFASQEEEEAVLEAVAVPFNDGVTRSAQLLTRLKLMVDKTVGAFAEGLSQQPVELLEEAAAAGAGTGDDDHANA